jgi:hypothetical protein
VRYVQSHTVAGEPTDALVRSRGAGEPYDGIAEIWLAGDTPPERAEAARAAGERLLADEAAFVDFARSTLFLTSEIEVLARPDDEATPLFVEPDLPRLHSRDYDVRAYRPDDDHILVRGAVRDVLPGGFYDDADQRPMTMHHMVVDLMVHTANLEITEARVVFEEHPHVSCPTIADHYTQLVGLSVARGFTHRVRELFGGPRGCTHTTALLQAMAPVVVQAHLGGRIREVHRPEGRAFGDALTSPEGRAKRVEGNRNTCHVWAEDGEYVERIIATGEVLLPLPIARRLQARGIEPDAWQARRDVVPDEK